MYAHTQQIYEEDCGIAVVITVAKQFRREISVTHSYIEQLNISDKSVSLYDLKQLLSLFGIFVEAYEIDDFTEVLKQKYPMIIRIGKADTAHYVVVHNYSNKMFTISDPAEPSIKEVSYTNLKQLFSGYALLVEKIGRQKGVDKKYNQNDFLKEIVKDSITNYQKLVLYLINFLVIIAPLIITSEINKLTGNISEFLRIVVIFIGSLVTYSVILFINARLRLKISNNVVGKILSRSHKSELKNFGSERTNDDISNYFWNIFNAGNGLVNKYFIQYDIFYAIALSLLVGIIDLRSACILIAGVCLTGIILIKPIKKLIDINKNLIEISGKWTDTFLKTLKGNVDIYVHRKEKSVNKFYNKKMMNYFNQLKNVTDQSTRITIIVDVSIFIIIALAIILSTNSIMRGTSMVYMLFMASQGFSTLVNDYVGYISGKSEIDFITSRVAWNDEDTESKEQFLGNINYIKTNNLIISLPNNTEIKYPNMEFNSGKSYLIIGDNGVGKSTFVKLLLGINKNFSGEVLINGTDLFDKVFIKQISYYANDLSIFDGTIKNNITLDNFDEEVKSDANIDKWGFSIDEKKFVHRDNISSGQKQKTLLLRALNKDADVYIFDEPLTNLDKESKNIFLKDVDELKNSGKIVLVISHEIPIYNFDKTYKFEDK